MSHKVFKFREVTPYSLNALKVLDWDLSLTAISSASPTLCPFAVRRSPSYSVLLPSRLYSFFPRDAPPMSLHGTPSPTRCRVTDLPE